jgi:hypothetical protein
VPAAWQFEEEREREREREREEPTTFVLSAAEKEGRNADKSTYNSPFNSYKSRHELVLDSYQQVGKVTK